MQGSRHQVRNLRKARFDVFSIVIFQPCFIRLVFSFTVFLACTKNGYTCISRYILKGITGIATILIDALSRLKVLQQLADCFTVMLTTRHKTALYRNALSGGDDLHLDSIEVLVLTGTIPPIDLPF